LPFSGEVRWVVLVEEEGREGPEEGGREGEIAFQLREWGFERRVRKWERAERSWAEYRAVVLLVGEGKRRRNGEAKMGS
jgi:hypothetical protein